MLIAILPWRSMVFDETASLAVTFGSVFCMSIAGTGGLRSIGSSEAVVGAVFIIGFLRISKTAFLLLHNDTSVAAFFMGLFPGNHTLSIRPEPAWQKMAQSPLNDTTQPVGERPSPTIHRQWIKENNYLEQSQRGPRL